MFGLSFGELVVLIIVAVVVIGPRDLPKVLRKLGQWAGKMRRMAADLRTQSGIDEVLREGDIGENIAEIRKLARGEIADIRRAADVVPALGASDGGANGAGTDVHGHAYDHHGHALGVAPVAYAGASAYDEVETAL